ncbi:MAG: polyphosphate kinase 2 family protein [Planctomycetota bacterium]|nr:polyphosphate kinase 2 family protein [Planctomycetota bacterium]
MNQYLVKPGEKTKLSTWDPDDNGGIRQGKTNTREEFENLNSRLEKLQELLYAESRHRILIVLQATDTGGKDGTIRHVFNGVNPQGVKVASFKKPTPEESAHDFLWRIHHHTPANGEMVIFNRSHYEDVLVARVHQLVPEARWRKRYEHINAFEKMLADEGTKVLKFFLHIGRDEQRERLQERLDRPEKTWKFSKSDLEERKHWDAYQKAYEEMLHQTSTEHAPWHVIPANRKWYRNLLISRILVEILESLEMRYPEPETGLDSIVIEP